MKISIIDYGAGNLPSVERAFASLGAETERVTRAEQIKAAGAIVLPGVGHFSAFVAGLRREHLAEALREACKCGTPILGICLGLHAMFASSEEAPGDPGLGFLAGEVRMLPKTVKAPHIGWNQVEWVKESALLRGIPEGAYFYFAHSFAAPAEGAHTAAICDHGMKFAAVTEADNLMGVQFHPEKSGEAGAAVLGNFLKGLS